MAWFSRRSQPPTGDINLTDVDSVVAWLDAAAARSDWNAFGAIALGGLYAEAVRFNKRPARR